MNKKLRKLEVGKTIRHRNNFIQAVRTPFSDNICSLCIYGEYGKQCPRILGQKQPVCFSSHRPDRESVYFRYVTNEAENDTDRRSSL